MRPFTLYPPYPPYIHPRWIHPSILSTHPPTLSTLSTQAAIRFIVPMRKRPRVDQLFSSFESSAAGGHGAGLNLQL